MCECGAGAARYKELEPVFSVYAERGGLIAILQRAQDLYGWLSEDLIRYIAERVGIWPAKVYGVATFYTQFRLKPIGKHHILLCQGTACHVNGSSRIEEAVREALGIDEGEITPDGMFTYNNVACLGCCSLSPVMMVDGTAYGSLTKDKAQAVINSIRENDAAKGGETA